jgi:hypothetical protein
MEKAASKAKDAVAYVRTAVEPSLTGASEALWKRIEKLFEHFPALPSGTAAMKELVMNAWSPTLHGMYTNWDKAFFTYIFRVAGGKVFSSMFSFILGYICGKQDGYAKGSAALAVKIKKIMRQENVQKTLEMAPRSTGRRSPRRSTPRRSSGRRSPRRSTPRRATPRRSAGRRKSPRSGEPRMARAIMGIDELIRGPKKSPAVARLAAARKQKLKKVIRKMNTESLLEAVENAILKRKTPSPKMKKSPKRQRK